MRLGDLYTKQDKPEEARSSLNRAMAIIESRSGPADATLAIPLELFGLLERDQGNYELAETMTRRAIAVTEAHQGPDDRHLVPLQPAGLRLESLGHLNYLHSLLSQPAGSWEG